jgi:hypothetical protein
LGLRKVCEWLGVWYKWILPASVSQPSAQIVADIDNSTFITNGFVIVVLCHILHARIGHLLEQRPLLRPLFILPRVFDDKSLAGFIVDFPTGRRSPCHTTLSLYDIIQMVSLQSCIPRDFDVPAALFPADGGVEPEVLLSHP